MAEATLKQITDEWPDISGIVTEDDTPVDNLFSEKQQRLLTDSLNSSWKPGRYFLSAADVGIFYDPDEPPIVPDVFMSLDVTAPEDKWKERNRSYFLWEYGKPPEIAVEIVSNKKGGEGGKKLRKYAQAGVRYYVIFDPQKLIQNEPLRIFELSAGQYIPKLDRNLIQAGLRLTLWEGVYEESHDVWLRWVDNEGNIIPTGNERAKKEKQRADKEKLRADKEKLRADKEKLRADKERQQKKKLADKLRALGIDPDEIMNEKM
ncbi:MAG: Uma2 family endonuclease [Desulfobacterales bacterium]|nr:Uma2 family endonuclease [Desulfobacterales bacterium]